MAKRPIISAAVSVLLYFSGVFAFVAPAPFVRLFVSDGRKAAWTGMILATTAVFAIHYFAKAGIFAGLFFCYFAVVAVLLGEGVLRRWNIMKLSAVAVFLPWILAGVIAGAIFFVFGVPVIDNAGRYLTGVMDQAISINETSGAVSMSQMAYIREHMSELVNTSLCLIPSVSLLFSSLVVALAILFGRIKYLGTVSTWQFPFWLVWMTIGLGLFYFANVYLFNDVHVKYIVLNGLIFCFGMYFIQGCLIISFWLKQKKSPFLRIFICSAIVLFLQTVGFFIIALGLSDNWLNYRRKLLCR